jgi:hypothetical protein
VGRGRDGAGRTTRDENGGMHLRDGLTADGEVSRRRVKQCAWDACLKRASLEFFFVFFNSYNHTLLDIFI